MDKSTTKPHQALLVMDMITSIFQRFSDSLSLQPLFESVRTAIAAARSAGVPIIYAGIDFRKSGADINPASKTFGALRQNPQFLTVLSEPFVVDPTFEVSPEDILVTKKRVSAFTGSDLEVVLRSLSIQHLVLTGVATSGVVLSTLREAADKDYTLSVLSDGCADRDEEVHKLLLTKIFPTQAEVLTAQQWASGLTKG